MKLQEPSLTTPQREQRGTEHCVLRDGGGCMSACLLLLCLGVQGCHHSVMLSAAFSAFVLRCLLLRLAVFFGGRVGKISKGVQVLSLFFFLFCSGWGDYVRPFITAKDSALVTLGESVFHGGFPFLLTSVFLCACVINRPFF